MGYGISTLNCLLPINLADSANIGCVNPLQDFFYFRIAVNPNKLAKTGLLK
jgi:hypothetical protein